MNRHVSRRLLACCFAIALALPAAAEPVVEGGGAVRDVRDFDGVEISIPGEVILTQGEHGIPRDRGLDRRPRAHLDRRPRGHAVHRPDAAGRFTPRPRHLPVVDEERSSGLRTTSGRTIRTDAVTADSLRISIQSSGSVEVKSLKARTLDVEMNSSGDCTLAGSVDRQSVLINSSG